MKATRPLLLLLSLTAAAAACDDKKPSTPAPAPSASDSAKPLASAPAPSASSSSEARGEHMRGMRGGLTAMLVRGAKDVDLKDDQKPKLEKLAADLRSGQEGGPMPTEAKDLHLELVAEVRAGKIDNAKLDQKLGAIEKAAQAAKDKDADTANQLHALLDAGQRKTLVANVKAQRAGMQMRGRLGLERHVGGDADGGGPRPDGGGAKFAEEMAKRQSAKLTKELDLDDAQQKKLDAISAKNLPGPGKPGGFDMEKMQSQMDAALAAFESDTFDAKKLDGWKDAGKNARAMAQRQVQMFVDLVPVLKPEQREKLAKHLEAGPSAMRRGGHRGPPGMMPPMLFEDDDDAE